MVWELKDRIDPISEEEMGFLFLSNLFLDGADYKIITRVVVSSLD